MSEKSDIVAIVTQYIPLVGKGMVHRGYCPFCHSQSDNLFVRGDIQEWHCFECGAGGNLFEFVERIEEIGRDEVPAFVEKLLRGEVMPHGGKPIEQPSPTNTAIIDRQEGEFFSRLREIKGYIGAAILDEQGRMESIDHQGLVEPQFARLFPLLRGMATLSGKVIPGTGGEGLGRELVFSSESGAVVYLDIPVSGRIRTLMIALEDRARATMARHYGYALRNQDELEKTVIISHSAA